MCIHLFGVVNKTRIVGWFVYCSTTITWINISYFTDEILDLFSSYDSNAPDSAAPSSQHDPDSNLPSLAQGEQEGDMFSRPARSLISQEVLEALRTVDRKGRDVVVGLSNACCKWGCSKGEISSLCWETNLLYGMHEWIKSVFVCVLLHHILCLIVLSPCCAWDS